MLKGHMILIGLLVGVSVLFLGCAGNLPETQRADVLDAHHGKCFEAAKNDQILNPEAGKEPTPVEGFDGESAKNQMDKYREGLKEVQEVKPSIGIGKAVSAGSY